jgi:hypothetical protein
MVGQGQVISAVVFVTIIWLLTSQPVLRAVRDSGKANARRMGLEYLPPARWLNLIVASYVARWVLSSIAMGSLVSRSVSGPYRAPAVASVVIVLTSLIAAMCIRAMRRADPGDP